MTSRRLVHTNNEHQSQSSSWYSNIDKFGVFLILGGMVIGGVVVGGYASYKMIQVFRHAKNVQDGMKTILSSIPTIGCFVVMGVIMGEFVFWMSCMSLPVVIPAVFLSIPYGLYVGGCVVTKKVMKLLETPETKKSRISKNAEHAE